MDFAYQAQTFSTARRCLMLPHPRGEAESIASAFTECSNGLQKFSLDRLDDDARQWAAKLQNLMDTTGLEDPSKRGLFAVKAEQLTLDQKIELSRLVDELADWFDMKFWERS